MVGVACLANFMSTGTSFYVFNAFLLPLCAARDWSRADLNLAPGLGYACGLLAQFTYGGLIPRLGARWLMTLGPFLASFAFVMLGRVESLWLFVVCYVLLQLGNAAMSGIVSHTVLSNWFAVKRGRAIGLATTGISLSGAVLPYLALRLIEARGLAEAALVIGLGVLGVAPLAWVFIRTTPEECGYWPDGAANPPPADGPGGDGGRAGDRGLEAGQVWRRGSFWKLGLAYALGLSGAMGVMFQIAPRFQDLGLDSRWAMALTAVMALLGAAGKYLWGQFCDWWPPLRVVWCLFLVKALGLGLGLAGASAIATAAFVLVFGFAMGGVMSTYPILTAVIFGRGQFTRVYRMLVLFLALQGLGYLVMGQSFARTGSYDMAYLVFLLLDLIAAGLVASIPRKTTQAR
jgi:hypothetical protein